MRRMSVIDRVYGHRELETKEGMGSQARKMNQMSPSQRVLIGVDLIPHRADRLLNNHTAHRAEAAPRFSVDFQV